MHDKVDKYHFATEAENLVIIENITYRYGCCIECNNTIVLYLQTNLHKNCGKISFQILWDRREK